MLQQKYGGCGVGFVTITSMTSGFRPTVRHSFSGWQSHSVMDSVFFDRSKLGVSGHYFIPNTGAYVELRGRRTMPPVWILASVPVFFYNRGTTTLSVRVNRGEATTETFEPIDDLQEMTVEEISVLSVGRWKVRTPPCFMALPWTVLPALCWITSHCVAAPAFPSALFPCG